LIGIFSIARGAHWDDPYPGYGPRHRRMEDARDRAEELAQRLAGDVDEAKDAADVALAEVSTQSQQAVTALRQAIARTQNNAAAWDYTVAEIMTAGRDAIDLYREANRAERTTPAPAYFARDPFIDEEPPSSAELLEDLRSAFARATANITACKSQLAGARAQLEAEYHSFYDDELGPLLKGILETAKASVRVEFIDEPLDQPQRRASVAHENADAASDALDGTEAEPAPVSALSFRRRVR
jgi:multidrug efflux pump subunit AcrA (membrane-fusion protein)